MDFAKLYIQKCLSHLSILLKIDNNKKELIKIIEERIINSDNLNLFIKELKKNTYFSKTAIKLSTINDYCNNPEIDFTNLSNKFSEHILFLSKDFENLLLNVNKETIKEVLLNAEIEAKKEHIRLNKASKEDGNEDYNIDNTNKLKEDFILSDDDNEENSYEYYVRTVISSIKELDLFLKKLESNEASKEEIENYLSIVEKNGILSKKYGFELIADMHFIFEGALTGINEHKLMVEKDIIEKMRACLIVVAALVKQKEVDITNYLIKADKLGKLIQNIKG